MDDCGVAKAETFLVQRLTYRGGFHIRVPTNTWFLGPHESTPQTASRSGGSRPWSTDTQTDRQTTHATSVAINRILNLCYMQCSLKLTFMRLATTAHQCNTHANTCAPNTHTNLGKPNRYHGWIQTTASILMGFFSGMIFSKNQRKTSPMIPATTRKVFK